MQQFDFIAELFVAGGIVSALVIAVDLPTHPQPMRIMNSVWILTGLWANVFGLLAYFWFGRARRRHPRERTFAAATADGMLAESVDNDNGTRESRIVQTAGEPEMKAPGAGNGGEEPGDKEPDVKEPDGKEPGGEEPDGEEPGGEEPGGEEPGGDEPDGEEPGGEEPGGFDGRRDMNGNMPGRTHGCDMIAAIPGRIAVTATMPGERDVNGNFRPESGTGTLHETAEERAVTDTIRAVEPDYGGTVRPRGIETPQTPRTGGMAGMTAMKTESEISGKDSKQMLGMPAGMQGMQGMQGTNRTTELSGMQGTDKMSGMSGMDGKATAEGTNGTTELSGMQGSDKISGMSGMSGMDGKTTAEGTNETTELSGMQGSDKISGISGMSGMSGMSEMSGMSGMSGMQGATGMNGMPGMQMPRRPKWQSVVLSTLHCGAGCTLADLVGEWFMFFVPIAIGGSLLAGTWVLDYALALVFGIGFQYAAIRGMERSVPRGEAVKRAAKADILSLTAWQAGMYGWMAVMLFVLGDGEAMPRTSFAFWFMMQVAMAFGFLLSLPVNVLLIRKGIKKGM